MNQANKNNNKWDSLVDYFKNPNAISADNVEIVEPVLIKRLKKIKNLNIIDLGCGTGAFCKRIASFANSILGIDTSKEMIKLAKKNNSNNKITYSNKPLLSTDISGYNVLNATFVFEFLSDDESIKIIKYLKNNNITILITNDTDKFIYKTLDKKLDMYTKKADQLFINIDKKSFRIYPRNIDDYQALFSRAGFKLVKKYYYKFPKSFIEKFPEYKQYPLDVPPYVTLEFINK